MMTGTTVSVQEYLHTYYHPDTERSVGDRRHSRTQALTRSELHSREAEPGFEVLPTIPVAVPLSRMRLRARMELPQNADATAHRSAQ
jgi:hypothetical protein